MNTRSKPLIPGRDFIPNQRILGNLDYVLQLEPGSEVFDGPSRASYETLRESFVLVLREKPVVPCMTDTPLPSKFMSKATKSKLCNTYLRPWTLVQRRATAEVPFPSNFHTRKEWKTYLQQVLPHAVTTVRNFMMNSLAEGTHDDDEDLMPKGTKTTCVYTMDRGKSSASHQAN